MKQFYLIAMTAVAMLMAVSSCHKDAEYVAPQGVGIKLTPTNCHPGDTVTALLVYGAAGENWYWYEKTSTFKVPGNTFVPIPVGFEKKNQILGACNSDTYCKFIAPDSEGTHNVTFSGQISITACQPGESIWGDRIDCTSKLTVTK